MPHISSTRSVRSCRRGPSARAAARPGPAPGGRARGSGADPALRGACRRRVAPRSAVALSVVGWRPAACGSPRPAPRPASLPADHAGAAAAARRIGDDGTAWLATCPRPGSPADTVGPLHGGRTTRLIASTSVVPKGGRPPDARSWPRAVGRHGQVTDLGLGRPSPGHDHRLAGSSATPRPPPKGVTPSAQLRRHHPQLARTSSRSSPRSSLRTALCCASPTSAAPRRRWPGVASGGALRRASAPAVVSVSSPPALPLASSPPGHSLHCFAE